MYSGQVEKYISTVFTFGEQSNLNANNTQVSKGFLPAPGGKTSLVTTGGLSEFAIVIPRNGILKNLYWSAEGSLLTAVAGNSITVYTKIPTAASSTPTGLTVTWGGNTKSGSNITNSIPVSVNDTVSVLIQLAKGGGSITRPRVTIELEVDNLQYPNPWDLTGSIVSYMGGNVGIGTASPSGELHVKNAAAGGIAGVFETPSGKILSGRVGATEKFNVDANGNLYASGKVGIGNTAPSTELDVNGTVQMTGMKLTTGAANNYVLTSDANGVGTWQPTGGGAGTVDGSGTVNAIPKFLGATTIDDSVIYQDGNNIGIGTDAPATTLDVNGAISGFGIVPIGSIIGWHKNLAGIPPLTGTPPLPEGWVECNGQILNDISSLYNGQIIPNLNGDLSILSANSPNQTTKEKMFLRGGTTSGTGQADAFQSHKHPELGSGHQHYIGMNGTGQPGGYGAYATSYNGNVYTPHYTNPVQVQLGDPVDSGTGAGTARIGNETRPINMSVVWIMRVK